MPEWLITIFIQNGNMKSTLLIGIFVFFLQSCFAVEPPTSNSEPISHEIWNNLLKKYVNDKGFVNYAGFKKDQKELKKYLDILSNNAPNEKWTQNEQLAYWINAYNAFTVQLILDNADKGLTSIKDIGDKIKIPFINTAWDIKFIKINGKVLDLNNIEHGIIRKKFNEPRIHFALVCAAKSCPPLRNEAFVAEKLDAQLDSQAIAFINDSFKNQVSKNSLKISKIFSWYGSDFKGNLIDWINKYAKTKANSDAQIKYLDYDWALNGKL